MADKNFQRLIVNLVFFVLFFSAQKVSAQQTSKSIDEYIANYTIESVLADFIQHDSLMNVKWAVQSSSEIFTFLLQQELVRVSLDVVEEKNLANLILDISTKGNYSKKGEQYFLDGAILVKLIHQGSIVKTKRYSIQEKTTSITHTKSELWELTEGESSSSKWTKWVEPGLILSAMIVSVYLLFTVRS